MAEANGLDETDRAIVALMARDSRQSARAIARELGLAPGTVIERIEKLQARRVIRGFRADLDAALLGYPMEFIVCLQLSQAQDIDETIQRLLEVPHVVTIAKVTGSWDLFVRVRAKDFQEVDTVLLRGLTRWSDFKHSETMLIIQRHEQRPDWFVSADEYIGRENKAKAQSAHSRDGGKAELA